MPTSHPQSKDTSFELKLSNNRKVTISEFKGVVRVDVREYYEASHTLYASACALNHAVADGGVQSYLDF